MFDRLFHYHYPVQIFRAPPTSHAQMRTGSQVLCRMLRKAFLEARRLYAGENNVEAARQSLKSLQFPLLSTLQLDVSVKFNLVESLDLQDRYIL